MGSSSRGSSQPPQMPQPPADMQVPYGQTSPQMFQPQYTSVLPTDPTGMASGLTPDMITAMQGTKDPAELQAEANKNALAEAMAGAGKSDAGFTPQMQAGLDKLNEDNWGRQSFFRPDDPEFLRRTRGPGGGSSQTGEHASGGNAFGLGDAAGRAGRSISQALGRWG